MTNFATKGAPWPSNCDRILRCRACYGQDADTAWCVDTQRQTCLLSVSIRRDQYCLPCFLLAVQDWGCLALDAGSCNGRNRILFAQSWDSINLRVNNHPSSQATDGRASGRPGLLRVVATGGYQTMGCLQRAHRVSASWPHEVCQLLEESLVYNETVSAR